MKFSFRLKNGTSIRYVHNVFIRHGVYIYFQLHTNLESLTCTFKQTRKRKIGQHVAFRVITTSGNYGGVYMWQIL